MSQTRNRLPKRGRPLDSSPLNKTEKKHKDTEAETYCTICQEVILEGEEGQDAVFCEGQCQSWIHRKCSGLTSQAFEKICESDDKYMCPYCLLSMQNCELKELRNIVKSLSEKLDQLTGSPPPANASKKDTVQTVSTPESNTDIVMNDTSNDIAATVTSLINEEREKEKRKLNVIVHNLPECDDPDPSNRKSHDISKTSSIVDKYLSVPTTITQAIRIGKKREKPRLLKITFNSSQEKAAVLRSCTKLRKSDVPEDVRRIYITPDLTPKEQELNKTLRSQLAEKNKNGNQYRIKNGKIVRRSET